MSVRLAPVLSVLILAACAADRTAAPRAPTPAPAAAVAPPAPPALVSPEGIRLPRTFRPTAQRVWLTIVPSSPDFTGRTEIDGTLDSATDVVWLNADVMEVATARRSRPSQWCARTSGWRSASRIRCRQGR